MKFRRLLIGLIAAALALPVAFLIVVAVARLLHTMGDPAGGKALEYVAWTLGMIWALDLISLLVAQALASLVNSGDPDE